MINWLFDHRGSVLLLLGTAIVILLAAWRMKANRRLAQAAAVVGGLLAVYLLAGLVYETPTQQATRKIKAMAQAASRHDVPGIFEHVSDDFANGFRNKAALRGLVDGAIQSGEVETVTVWGFSRAQFPNPAPGEKATGTISFKFKIHGPNIAMEPNWDCTASFVKDSDGQWRLRDVQLFPFNSKDEYRLP